MSRIRGKWTLPERKVHNFLKSRHVRHTMHPKMTHNPDVLIKNGVVLFIDGCFWHKCPKHYRAPKTNASFWRHKINTNVLRDRQNTAALRSFGYRVVRIWECELRLLLREGLLLERINKKN